MRWLKIPLWTKTLSHPLMSGFVSQGIINFQSCSNDRQSCRYSLLLVLIGLEKHKISPVNPKACTCSSGAGLAFKTHTAHWANVKIYIKNDSMQSSFLKFVFLNERTYHSYQIISRPRHCQSTEVCTNSRLSPNPWNNLVVNVFLRTSLVLWV